MRMANDRWWVPLSWASSLINAAFNTKEKGSEALIPKDHKDCIGVILKLRNDLNKLAEYRLKPLPAIYKQVCVLQFLFNPIWPGDY